MLFTIYERACAVSELNNEELANVLKSFGLPVQSTPVMARNVYTYLMKMALINDKQKALDNLMTKIDTVSSSNIEIINQSTALAQQSFRYRQNLEISILESQLKMLAIEEMNIKLMTANDFIAKYGV